MKPFTRILLLLSGWIAVILATLGLCCRYCRQRRSCCWQRGVSPVHLPVPSLAAVPLRFGGYIRHWQTHKGLPRKAKRRAVIVILLTFAVSLWLVKLIYIRLLLLCILVWLLIFMLRLPETDEMTPENTRIRGEITGLIAFR